MSCLPVLLCLMNTFPQSAAAQDRIDTGIVAAIRDQAFHHSQIMDIAFHLTDASGPRLSNSPGLARAQAWAMQAMTAWGIDHVAREPWGTFGDGWEIEKCYLALKAPYYQTLTACPRAWTTGSQGPFETEVVLYHPKDSAEQAALHGHLRGKLILYTGGHVMAPSFEPSSIRFTDSELAKMAAYQIPEPQPPAAQVHTSSVIPSPAIAPRKHIAPMVPSTDFFQQEGVLGTLETTGAGDGLLQIGAGGSYKAGVPSSPMKLVLMQEDDNRLQRLLESGITIRLEGDVRTRRVNADSIGYNVIGEIPGTDPHLKDQVVMLGGHLDSWHAATGATDNGAGAAVMLEALRILKTLQVKPRRTIRVVLWSGEEQGLLGSRGYVKKHFGDPQTRQWTPEQAKVSAYYNLDNGTGKIRGIYLQEDSAAGPIFRRWLAPFKDLGASTVTLQDTWSTDHESFVADGIPGFQFIQDPIEYETHTHHSNMDSYDHLLPADLQQAAAITAAFVYQTAMREEMIPRKALPKKSESSTGH